MACWNIHPPGTSAGPPSHRNRRPWGLPACSFEALLTAARESPNPFDFALAAMLELLGLRISEATGPDIADLGEEYGHRLLRVCGKATDVVVC
jgi:integrase/recombinase XerD